MGGTETGRGDELARPLETINAKAGWSREGPAVRFLMEVLPRAYPGTKKISGGAIERVLSN
jgi:hypothetical protein